MAADGLRGIVYIPFKQKSAVESTELFMARVLGYNGPKPTEKCMMSALNHEADFHFMIQFISLYFCSHIFSVSYSFS